VDGTRDQPPGKAAENWGRRDGIRAGAVSGPWRSGPRGAAAPVPRSGGPEGHGPTGHEEFSPQAVRELRRGYADEHHAQSQRWLVGVLWIAFGALAAVVIVIAAFMFRPETQTWRPEDAVPGEVAAPGGDAAAPASDPAAATPAAPAGQPGLTVATAPLQTVGAVRLRIGPGFPEARRDEIVAALTAAGVRDIRIEALPFRIATSRVGYYRSEDLAAAQALGQVVAPVIAAGSEVGVRDYGQLLNDPEPGRLDLWVGD
jgi:hypothetical protein